MKPQTEIRNPKKELNMKKEHPILFSTEMVKAILVGRKTMTRRIIKQIKSNGEGKWNYDFKHYSACNVDEKDLNDPFFGVIESCPYGQIGDILWVRERWKENDTPIGWPYHYYAANDTFTNPDNEKWKPSIFMPRSASRITLEITDIKVERVQDISEADALAEGVTGMSGDWENAPSTCFHELWNSINGTESWDVNCWVWVISFKRID